MGNIWVTPHDYFTVNNIDSIYLSVNQAPEGTGLNQNELAPYYNLEWTQIDTMPSVTWIGDADVQIASVTGFSEVGVYTFQYAYNPGTACESIDIMTVTVEECDFSSVKSQSTISVKVYPSLTDGLLNISLENTSTANINVLDLNGKIVFSEKNYGRK